MAKKRKCNSQRKRKVTRKPNPAAPSLRTGRLIPVRAVKVDKNGKVVQVIVENKNMRKALKRGK